MLVARLPEPLFHDPYAACLAAVDEQVIEQSGGYELATSYIDEEVLNCVKRGGDNPIRQVVILLGLVFFLLWCVFG